MEVILAIDMGLGDMDIVDIPVPIIQDIPVLTDTGFKEYQKFDN